MPATPTKIELMLKEINQHMLCYFLRQYLPSSRPSRPDSLAAEARRIARTSGLEAKIQKGIACLFEDDAEGSSLSSNQVYDVMYHAVDASEIDENPDQGLTALKTLKGNIVRFCQGVIMQKVTAYLSAVSATYLAIMADSDARKEFMQNGDDRHGTDRCIEEFVSLLKSGPAYIEDYMKKVRSAFDEGDMNTAVSMLSALQENMVAAAIRPTGFKDGSDDMKLLGNEFGTVRYSYAKTLMMLDEMQVRLSNIRKLWPGAVEQVFGKDHADDISQDKARLEALRKKMMNPYALITKDAGSFDDDIDKAHQGLEDAIMAAALKGPMHLVLAQRFVEQCISDINREVFSIGVAPVERNESDNYLIVIEPRVFRSVDPEKTRVYGFTQEEIMSLGDRAHAMMSTYMRILIPLKRLEPDDLSSGSAGQGKGTLFHASKFVVIDLYDRECPAPDIIVRNAGR